VDYQVSLRIRLCPWKGPFSVPSSSTPYTAPFFATRLEPIRGTPYFGNLQGSANQGLYEVTRATEEDWRSAGQSRLLLKRGQVVSTTSV
jgi:hypothetical protein